MEQDIVGILSAIPVATFIDYLGVVVGVIAGALFAVDRKLDLIGVVSLGLVTGFGGGIIRDLLLQDEGIFFMEHPIAILGSIAIASGISLGRRHLINLEKPLFYIDAFTMAWYVLAGARKCLFAGAGAVISVILGSITGVGGGILRDICSCEMPRAFRPGKFYATSAVIGAVLYVVPLELGVPEDIASVLCVAGGFALTVLAERFNWHTHGGAPNLATSHDDSPQQADGKPSCPRC